MWHISDFEAAVFMLVVALMVCADGHWRGSEAAQSRTSNRTPWRASLQAVPSGQDYQYRRV